MRFSFLFPAFLSLSLLASGASEARAQDEAAPVPVVGQEVVPANPPTDTPAKTPASAERNAQRRAQNEMRLRAMMQNFGIGETAAQDALISYLAEDEAGKSTVRSAARRLMMAVRTEAAPSRMRDLIAVYKASVDADKERRRAAQSALDAKIGFSLSPRLEATLWLLGVLGEGQPGISLSAFTPREGPRDALARRSNVVRGVVTQKAEGWIEVRADNGITERYSPFETDDTNRAAPAPVAPLGKEENTRFNRATLDALVRVQVGQRVRLEWTGGERKRVVRLDILSPITALPQVNTPALKSPDGVPIIPVYPIPQTPEPVP